MIRSRVTLAATEAAAIEKLRPSPLTMVCTGQASGGAMLPSTRAMSGRTPSEATARAIASNAARRMLIRSISRALAAPTAICAAPRATQCAERPPADVPLRGGQQLRIVELVAQGSGKAARIEDHRGGDDRAGERPAPGLIDAADDPLCSAARS